MPDLSSVRREQTQVWIIGWIYTAWCKWPNSDFFSPLSNGTDWNCNMRVNTGKSVWIQILSDGNQVSFICGDKLDLIWLSASTPGYSLVLWVVRYWKCRSLLHRPRLHSSTLKCNFFILFLSALALQNVWWARSCCFTWPDLSFPVNSDIRISHQDLLCISSPKKNRTYVKPY